MSKSITKLARILSSIGQRLEPMTIDEVKKIEQSYNINLPIVYKDFLMVMGKGAGNFMKGSSVFFNEILSLRSWSNEVLLENNMPQLNSAVFVFWMHQGYQIAYFNLSEGSDPPVYFFSEGKPEKKFELKEPSLTNFFYAQLKMSFPDITFQEE